MSETRNKSILQSITLDVFKHILSFSSASMISTFGITCKESYHIIRKFYFDKVHHIAMIDNNGCYQIQFISFDEKERKSKDLIRMICMNHTNDNKSIQYLLENTSNINSFTWAKFIPKYYRLYQLHRIQGYWKLLNDNQPIINDLTIIKSVVMHKEIAPDLLNYNNNTNPFKNKIRVIINDNTYDILFWNGASPIQCNAFKIYDHQKDRNYYFMNFETDIRNIKWMWYDNDWSAFRQYQCGADAKAQIECSFQANLLHNFPLEFQQEDLFNCANLSLLKKDLIKQYGESKNHRNKLISLRCSFDSINQNNRLVESICQNTFSIDECTAYSRTIERIDMKNPVNNDVNNIRKSDFNLRMYSNIKS